MNGVNDKCALGCRPTSSVHPLLIDHVAKKLFSFLGWANKMDILSCRQVCKIWSNIITNKMKRMRLSRKLHFGYEDTDRIQKFVNDMRSSTNLPFDCYEFDSQFFISRNEEGFHDFLKVCTPFITCLSLKFGKHFWPMSSEEFKNTTFCSLKSLRIQCVHFETMVDRSCTSTLLSCMSPPMHPRDQSKMVLALLSNILNSAKELEKFELYLPSKHFPGDYAKLANEEFGSLIAKTLPLSVTSLKLLMEVCGRDLMELMRLKLKTLHLQFYGSEVDRDLLRQFLSSQRKTLVDVMIVDLESRHSLDHLVSFKFPKVKYLRIKGIEDVRFSFLENFSCLQKFVLITGTGFHKPPTKSGDERKCSYKTITEVELKFPIESPNLIHKLLIHMPNIKILRIQATQESNGAIEAIFQLMTGLAEFQIMFPRLCAKQQVDPIFTGLPLARCFRIREDEIRSREFQNRLLNEVRRKPGLDNLSYLEKFVVHAEESAIILTDISMYCAVLRLPSLKELQLQSDHNISLECMNILKQRFIVAVGRNQEASRSTRPQHHNDPNCMALVPI